MTIDESKLNINQSLLNTLTKASIKSSDAASSFAAILESQIGSSSTSAAATTTSSESNAAVEAFKEALSSKGALEFYQDYNFEKIEKLLEEKKAELEDKLGLSADAQSPLTGEARETALSSLSDMLDAYKKQLQEKMQAEDKLEQQASTLSTFLQELV